MKFEQESEVDPSLLMGLKLWWAWFWRFFIIFLLVCIGFGWLFILILDYFFNPKDTMHAILTIIFSYTLMVYVSAYVFRRLMTKKFGKYRLVIMKKEFE